MSEREVFIVGGGIAGMTAAFELTDPSNCSRAALGCGCNHGERGPDCSLPRAVHLYEKNFELGGKGASVRNEALDHRIEEHGLHIWFGYYENAFRLLDRCHRALDELERQGNLRWSTALRHVGDGFRPASAVGLADEKLGGDWTRWFTSFPEDDALPWNRADLEEPPEFDLRWFLPEVGRRTTALLHAAIRSLTTDDQESDLGRLVRAADLWSHDFDPVLDKLFSAALRWSSFLRVQSANTPRRTLVTLALTSFQAFDELLDYVRKSRDQQIAESTTARRLITILDLLIGATRGLLVAGIATDADIDRLDHWEWSDWLSANGVLGVTRDSVLVRALSYCLPFAYEKGSRDRPSFSAAVGIRLFVRTFFTYRGALMWKMNYGMGEVVFAPLYEVLQKRGVTFHFGHEFRRATTADARVTELSFDKFVADASKAAPTRNPRWPLSELRLPEGDLPYWPLTLQRQYVQSVTLDTSSSDVVFALPFAAIKAADPAFIESSQRWREARSGRPRNDGEETIGLQSVATQSVQLWLTSPATKLGWPSDITVSGFSEPFDTYSDMTDLLLSEPKPEDGSDPQGLVYLCSVRPDAHESSEPNEPPSGPERSVSDDLGLFLWERARYLWPDAVDGEGEFDEALVIGLQRQERLESLVQLLRASGAHARAPYMRENVAPSERYNLSTPGTAALRIEPGNTGFLNLFAAGDWTACILNAGCIEAATISGMLAAEAVMEVELRIIGRGSTTDLAQPDEKRKEAAPKPVAPMRG